MDNRTLLIALSLQPGMGPKTLQRILIKYTNLNDIFSDFKKKLLPAPLAHVLQNMNWQLLDDALEWAKNPECYILTCLDKDYPYLFHQLATKPVVLYLQGKISLLSQPQLAVVGSRHPSDYAAQIAYDWCSQLAAQKISLVSGLAIGIDTLVHQACVNSEESTIGVLGTGLRHIYPYRNKKLAEAILDKGLLMSEFWLDSRPNPSHFPRRNRLISGLSMGTWVVEAGEKSGSLITARWTIEQNRELYVLPGAVENQYCLGSNRLIQEGAQMILNCQEIIQHFQEYVKKCYNNENFMRYVYE